jgi:hypothetical protein
MLRAFCGNFSWALAAEKLNSNKISEQKEQAFKAGKLRWEDDFGFILSDF